jgi:hypothetical protein
VIWTRKEGDSTGFVLKVEPKGYSDRLNVDCQKRKE